MMGGFFVLLSILLNTFAEFSVQPKAIFDDFNRMRKNNKKPRKPPILGALAAF